VKFEPARFCDLGLRDTAIRGYDAATGGQVTIRAYGVADKVTLGDASFRNVVFLVFADSTHFFQGRPTGENGIFGLPEILMLGNVRWDADGNFDFGFPSPGPAGSGPNLALDGKQLTLQLEYEERRLTFGLDTGAQRTGLYARFAEVFAERVEAEGARRRQSGEGASGSVEYEAIFLPNVKLRAGGCEVKLDPAEISLRKNMDNRYCGNLGLDVLNQARVVTLDFDAMTLTLERRPLESETAQKR